MFNCYVFASVGDRELWFYLSWGEGSEGGGLCTALGNSKESVEKQMLLPSSLVLTLPRTVVTLSFLLS